MIEYNGMSGVKGSSCISFNVDIPWENAVHRITVAVAWPKYMPAVVILQPGSPSELLLADFCPHFPVEASRRGRTT